ncbi:MAG TPA: lipopolysaccharide biosynthesis protein [Candidatus Lachnoclostridium stercoripullorum]|mgnify:FL=1|uniref:Lipopolysaccharide biosynthesis protein n=1 Tax=Candidatus Lachnoclostridium stercoripullorum TaxID=2838635 RepID=A0A9D1W414_9FIRM|nr:lipopolysaccharide biosynthesis protein [Candidatus Lachnoclostridium stercoripullorum]
MAEFAKRFLIYRGDHRERQNVIWNTLGSGVYALASMVLAFIVMRMAGEDEGGIFGFGFSTYGQQMFIVAYFGIRPFHITDGRQEYTFGDYRRLRRLTCGAAAAAAALHLAAMALFGAYSAHKAAVIFLLAAYKVIDGYADVYESEFQRQGSLYLTGKSNTFRTVLSVAVFLITLQGTGNLTAASLGAVLAQAAGVLLFDVSVIRAGELPDVRFQAERGAGMRLLKNTALLFVSVFLDFYVFSAAKYAIDGELTDAVSGYFNILFMPTSVIYLAANFVIRPFLTRLTAFWNMHDLGGFGKIRRQIGLVIGGLTVLAVLGALILGKPVLGIMELILGESYRGSLTSHWMAFVFIILGGGLYALANLYYYLLVIMRRQGCIFLVYLAAAAAAWLLSPALVRRFSIMGAAVCYVGLMAALAVGFGAMQAVFFRREKEAEYDR